MTGNSTYTVLTQHGAARTPRRATFPTYEEAEAYGWHAEGDCDMDPANTPGGAL